jgi:integrase/recombinase XerD
MTPATLHGHLDSYLSLREALGFQIRVERTLLRDFVQFLETTHVSGPIRAQLAVDWACASSSKRGAGGAPQRLSMARGFLTYLRATLPETEVPERHVIASARRPKPFLFRTEQLHALMQAAHQAGPHNALRPYTFSTLLGLFASTGLRAGEALRLTMADVELDREPPVLHIRETKCHKSRLVPLHASTADHLRHYQAMRRHLRYDALSEVFFISAKGAALNSATLARWLTTQCGQLGIAPSNDARRPTLHALRHTFAVERMRRWYEAGADVRALLPTLSVYLGHVRPQDTYWYLSATPELLTAAAAKFQHYAARGETS